MAVACYFRLVGEVSLRMLSFWFFLVCKLVLCAGFLSVASLQDWRTRKVSNQVWLWFFPLCLGIGLFECVLMGSFGGWFGSVGVVVFMAFMMWFMGGVGGADAKCWICIGVMFPFFPLTSVAWFGVFVFMVASLLGGFVFCGVNVVCNVRDWRRGDHVFFGFCRERVWKKVLVFLFARRVDVGRVDCRFFEPVERVVVVEEDGLSRHLMPFGCGRMREAAAYDLKRYVGEGKIYDKVWASPTIPLVPFLTVSLFVMVLGWLFMV